MRNKFVYSCSVKFHTSGFGKLFESIFCLLLVGCGSIFPARSCQDAWKSGSQLARGQVNTEEEAKLCSPIHLTSETLAVQCVVQRCHAEEVGLSIDQCQLQASQFKCLSSICWAYFSDVMILQGCRRLLCIRPAADHQTVTINDFSMQVWLWEVLWSYLAQPLNWSSPVII